MIRDNRTTESRDNGSGPTPLIPAGGPSRMVVMFVGRGLTADVLEAALVAWTPADPPADSPTDPPVDPALTSDGASPDGTRADGTGQPRTRPDGVARHSASARDDGRGAEQSSGGTPTPKLALHTFTSQKAVLQEIRANPPQAILVEVDVKPDSRVRFCEMLRYRLPSVTLIAVAKPPLHNRFPYDALLPLPLDEAQVVALLREVAARLVGHVLQVGPIRLNVATRTVYTPNGQHHMTPKQSALLQFLMAHANEVVGRGEIMEAVWETDYLEDTRTLDVHIRWLRECIEPDPSNPVYLLTVRGKGYTLQV